MNKIFKYSEFINEEFDDDYDIKDRRETLITEIVSECIRDFCFVNGIEYYLEFGNYIFDNFDMDQDPIGFIEKGELRDPDSFHLYDDHFLCAQIKIQSPNMNVYDKEIKKERDENLISSPEFKNCLSHLKSSLERELDDFEFRVCDDDHIYLAKYEILYNNHE